MSNSKNHRNSHSQSQRASRRIRTRYMGAQGTLTGTLSANPIVYHNRDSSHTYLLQMNVESRTGNLNNDKLNHKASLVAYVPAGHTDYCAELRRESPVMVRYVVHTDYYLDWEGHPAQKTYLSARGVYPLYRGTSALSGCVRPRDAPAPQHAGSPSAQPDSHEERGRT